MKINWKVRIRNKAFWLALVPAVLLLVQAGAAVFGYSLDFGDQAAGLCKCGICCPGSAGHSQRPHYCRGEGQRPGPYI